MKRQIKILFQIVIIPVFVLLIPSLGQAQVDRLGHADTIIAEIDNIDQFHWTITLSLINDETIVGVSVPLRMTAGMNKIVADSATLAGGRVSHFAKGFFRADTAIQCVYVGAMANIAGPKRKLGPGSGRIATIYVSSLVNKPIERLDIDTTTVNYKNSLLIVADSVQGAGDSIHVDQQDTKIVPVFVVKKSR